MMATVAWSKIQSMYGIARSHSNLLSMKNNPIVKNGQIRQLGAARQASKSVLSGRIQAVKHQKPDGSAVLLTLSRTNDCPVIETKEEPLLVS
jgi:hypothetical protein